MKTGKRNSNFELLRIIAMVMIVSLHTLGHGGGLNNTTVNSINFIFNHILESLSIVAVNIFILISGYFGIKSYSSVKSKISLLYKQMIFYSIIIGFIGFFTASFNKKPNFLDSQPKSIPTLSLLAKRPIITLASL